MLRDLHLSQLPQKPSANIWVKAFALIAWLPDAAYRHLKLYSDIKIDFQPFAQCIIHSSENKSTLQLSAVTTI